MPSIGSYFAQIPGKDKYLLTTNTTNFYCPLNTNKEVPTFMTEAQFSQDFAPPNPPYASGTLLRDMGKQFVVLGTNKMEVAKYTLVQQVSGQATEGVPSDYANTSYGKQYVRIWHAAPDASSAATRVSVARIG